MDEKEKRPSTSGKNRAVNFFTLRLLVAGYLAWLGFDLLRGFLTGASALSPAAAWGCGVGFMAAGLGFAVYSIRRYRRETAAADAEKTPGEE